MLKLIQKNPLLQEKVSLFGQQSSSMQIISKVGKEVFVQLYGGKNGDSLGELRFKIYMKMVSTSSKVCPSKLPPTERSAHFHSLRVHLQVMIYIYNIHS